MNLLFFMNSLNWLTQMKSEYSFHKNTKLTPESLIIPNICLNNTQTIPRPSVMLIRRFTELKDLFK